MTKQAAVTKPATNKKSASVKRKAPGPRTLTEHGTTYAQEQAIAHFVLNDDKSAAYRHAYPRSLKWKDKTVNSSASTLFAGEKVARRVAALQAQKAEIAKAKFNVDAEYVLGRHVEIDQMDIADILDDEGGIKPVKDWPKVWRQSISALDLVELMTGKGDDRQMTGLLKKIKWPDKVTNLINLGKHVSVNAYREQLGVSDPNGDPLENVTRIELVPATSDD